MWRESGSPPQTEVSPAINHARRAAAYRTMLSKIVEIMVEQGGEDHPWIPGANAQPLLKEIRLVLATA